MKTFRSSIFGIMAAVLSGFFVLGILSLGISEGLLTMPPTMTTRPTMPVPNLTPILVIQVTTTQNFLPTSTYPPAPTQCPPPAGWQPYIVQPGDNLSELAALYGITLKKLMDKNCLVSSQLVPDTIIYLPPVATSTATLVRTTVISRTVTVLSTITVCRPPAGWIMYQVKPGDTLTRISILYRVSVTDLIKANCLETDFIRAGMVLWVPNVATSTMTPSPTPTRTEKPPTIPPTVVTPTPTNTSTPTDTATYTPPPMSTGTDTPTTTSTYTDTATVTPTDIPTSTQMPPGGS